MKKRLFCLLTVLVLALLQTAFSMSLAEETAQPETTQTAVPQPETVQPAGTWICGNCGAANTGSFCEECGTAKPGWTCICGSRNEKKFCPVCGSSYDTLLEIYTEAVELFENGEIPAAGPRFEYLKGFNDSEEYLEKCRELMPTATPVPETPAPEGTINFDDPSYDPANEEQGQTEEIIPAQGTPAPAVTPAPTDTVIYPGATPMVIDPVDKPTPTPLPRIEFKDSDYTTYECAELHLSFQAPAGWIEQGPTSWEPGGDMQDTFILTNPDLSLDYAAQIRIRVVPVSKQYSKGELDKEVKAVRDAVRSELGFAKFDNYDLAGYNFIKTRDPQSPVEAPKYKFIDNKGRYTRFKGTLKETGAKVGGRVIVNCYNKKLYILVCSYPGGELQETFEDVYRKVRDTLWVDE